MNIFACLSVLPTLQVLLIIMVVLTKTTALPPVIVKDYKWFDSTEMGQEFVVRGVDYFPRPNRGKLDFNSMDLYTEDHRHIWERDIPILQELGVNAIRLYAVNASLNHDSFMCAMEAAGIYVMVALAHDCPTCAVTRDKAPECYPPELKRQGQQVVAQFSKYSNTLAFSAGNEVNHYAPVSASASWNAPCQKRFLRDMREYMASCSNSGMRQVPVGLVSADNEREDLAMYFNCRTDDQDPYERAEWYGLNSYVYCDGNATEYNEALGLNSLQQSFESFNYSIPVLLTEFGCLSPSFSNQSGVQGQRNFLQAQWMLDQPKMRQQFAGGFAFEYSMEYENAHQESPYPYRKFGKQTYGIGYFAPENCDDIDIECVYQKLPSFYSLKAVYSQIQPINTTTSKRFQPDRRGPSTCPKDYPALGSLDWSVVDEFPDVKCPRAKDSNLFCSGKAHNQASFRWFSILTAATVPLILLVASAVAFLLVAWKRYNLCVSHYSEESTTLLTVKGFPTTISHAPTENGEEGDGGGGELGGGKYRSFQTTKSDLSSCSDSVQV